MTTKDRGKKDDQERTVGAAKSAAVFAAGALVPVVGIPAAIVAGAGVLGDWLLKHVKDDRRKRVDDLFSRLLSADGGMTEEQCREAVDKEEMCSEIITRLSWKTKRPRRSGLIPLVPRVRGRPH